MKIILKEEVINVGLAGDLVEVADGFARNFLIPRGKAILASRGAMKEAELLTRSRKVKEAETVDDARAMGAVLESRALRIPARVDDLGHLYGSVSATDVHRVLKERGHEIDKRRIELRGSIKQLGTYEIPVQIHPQVTATVTVEVVDIEGRVLPGGKIEGEEVDSEAVSDAAAEVAEGSSTDPDALAEQALQAARDFEQQQAETAAADALPGSQDADETGDPIVTAAQAVSGADDEADTEEPT